MYDLVCGEPVEHDELVEEDDYYDDIAITQLPWMVSLGDFTSDTKWKHDCGGSVITKRYSFLLLLLMDYNIFHVYHININNLCDLCNTIIF